VVDELRLASPGRVIEVEFGIDQPVNCDRTCIGQLLSKSNLLGNALTHGATGKPVVVHAETADGSFKLWVANAGESAAVVDGQAIRAILSREGAREQGLGLGLYIASDSEGARRRADRGTDASRNTIHVRDAARLGADNRWRSVLEPLSSVSSEARFSYRTCPSLSLVSVAKRLAGRPHQRQARAVGVNGYPISALLLGDVQFVEPPRKEQWDGMRWKASHRKYLFVELLARSPFLLASGGGPGNDQTLNTGVVETTCEAFKLGRDFDSCLQHPLHGLSFWIHRRFLRPRRVDFVCEPLRQRSQQCLLLLKLRSIVLFTERCEGKTALKGTTIV
jgi:hypothetical protein